MWRICLLLTAVVMLLAVPSAMAAPENAGDLRAEAQKAAKNGNWNDAYKLYSKLALDANNAGAEAGGDLRQAISSLQQLGRMDEADDFREKAITAHAKDWAFLRVAAESYIEGEHYGFILAGKFYRGSKHGNDGKQVNSMERDRIRALQLMSQGLGLLDVAKVADTDKPAAAQFYFTFANMLLNGYNGAQAWKLQTLSDLTVLPDYEEGYGYGYYGRRGRWGGEGTRGAPVDEKGNPVFHVVPKSWAVAASDGQRWRWCLLQASELGLANQVRLTLAQFLQEQFDVQTMAYGGYGGSVGRGDDSKAKDGKKDEAGPFAVSTLGEDETIARLANGVKRFKLPDEFNFIKLFGVIAADNAPENSGFAPRALESLGQIFENRQQYPRAAGCWKECIARYGPGQSNCCQEVEMSPS